MLCVRPVPAAFQVILTNVIGACNDNRGEHDQQDLRGQQVGESCISTLGKEFCHAVKACIPPCSSYRTAGL